MAASYDLQRGGNDTFFGMSESWHHRCESRFGLEGLPVNPTTYLFLFGVYQLSTGRGSRLLRCR